MCGGAFANAIRAIEHKPRKEITDRKIYESKIVPSHCKHDEIPLK